MAKDLKRVDDRWYPTKMNYKDMLDDGKRQTFVVLEIKFDVDISAYIFSNAALKS